MSRQRLRGVCPPRTFYLDLLVTALIVLPALFFFASRASLAGDGARITEAHPPGDTSGFLLRQRSAGDGQLQADDILVAIEGKTVDAWLSAERLGTAGPARAQAAGSLRYSVVRDGNLRDVRVALSVPNLLDLIRDSWITYLYLIYLLGVSLLIFFRRPHLPAARGLLYLSSVIFGSGVIFFLGIQPLDLVRGWPLLLWLWGSIVLYAGVAAGLLHFALIFPRPRDILLRRRWIPAAIYLGVWLPYLALLVTGWSGAPTHSARLLLILRSAGGMTALYFPLALIAAITGYQRSFDASERRQVRWVIWGMVVAIVPWLILSVLPELLGRPPFLSTNMVGLIWLIIPTTFAIAILRENLFDIDTLINRSLVYFVLSGALLAVYFTTVLILQRVVPAESQLALVASTLTSAALFSPLRSRIQRDIDRRFYRHKYDADRTLQRFSVAARDQVDLDGLSKALMQAVQETLQPAHLTLTIIEFREDDRR